MVQYLHMQVNYIVAIAALPFLFDLSAFFSREGSDNVFCICMPCVNTDQNFNNVRNERGTHKNHELHFCRQRLES